MDPPAPKRDNTHPSCLVCQRRKVKCNRVYPCAACTKSDLQCSFPTSSRKRQRRRKEASISGTVSSGVSLPSKTISDVDDQSPGRAAIAKAVASTAGSPATDTPRLVSDEGGFRYVNNYLWSALPRQQNTDRTATMNNSVGDGDFSVKKAEDKMEVDTKPGKAFIFGSGNFDTSSIRLPADQIIALWQTYIQNVDPLMKIFHTPTVQQWVLGQIGKPALSINQHCLVGAIYFISVITLTDVDCQDMLQASRYQSIDRFRDVTERALSAAGFMTTTDLTVVQAFVLYLMALKSLGETQAVWSMTAMAARMASSLGLARDGTYLELSPFESEIRRRLWWTIVYLDARTAELTGQDGELLVQSFDVQLPSNLSDSDLFPAMSKLPEPRAEATDSIYIYGRATIGHHLRTIPGLIELTRATSARQKPNLQRSVVIDGIKKAEVRINEETLGLCDPSVPLQLLAIIAGKIFSNKLRLLIEYTSSSLDTFSLPMFELSLEAVELSLALLAEPSLQGWRWYWLSYFQWFAMAILIRQTRLHPPGPEVVRAWTSIRKVFDQIIPLITIGPKKSLLLEAMKTLLNAGSNGHLSQASEPTPNSTQGTGCTMESPKVWHMPNGALRYGMQPHTACLPGMLATTGPSTDASLVAVNADQNDPFLDFDIDAIDWEEFDRLASELYQQQNFSEVVLGPGP